MTQSPSTISYVVVTLLKECYGVRMTEHVHDETCNHDDVPEQEQPEQEQPEPFRPNRTTFYELHVPASFRRPLQVETLLAGQELHLSASELVTPERGEVLRSTIRRWPSPAPASKDWELVRVAFEPDGLAATIRATKDHPERPVLCVFARTTYAPPADAPTSAPASAI